MVNIRDLIDEAKCFQTIRDMRWPDRFICPDCSSELVIKDARDDTPPHRQRYLGHDQPLRTWIVCLNFMGLNLSSLQIARELDMDRNDLQAMNQ